MKTMKTATWALTALVAAVGVVTWFAAPELLATLSREDGVIEYGTALLYLLSAGAFAYAGSTQKGLWRLWTWGLALVTFLVAGEEISWGQRILGVATPAELQTVNVQHEMNLHNIDGIHQNVRLLGMLFILGVCYAIPLAHRYLTPARALLDRFKMPVFPIWALATATLAIGFMVVPRLQGSVVFELDEVGELLLSMAMGAFAGATAVSCAQQRPDLIPSAAATRAA